VDEQYNRRLAAIEAALAGWLPDRADASWLARVFGGGAADWAPETAAALTAPGRDLVRRGGKRWRPLLMALVAEGLGGLERALPLTPLVELPHNASLIHDDIEDASEERRGQPAAHLVYGMDTAINSGSFLYFLPLACLSSWDAPAELKARVFAIWGEYMRRLHLGQSLDISWHRDFALIPRLEEYDRMCRLKTGCLPRLAAALGVLAGHGEPLGDEAAELARALGEAAEGLGAGFQILDDVKNLSGGVSGKRRGDDVVEGKKSLPVLLYLRTRPEGKGLAARCFAAAREKGTDAPEVGEFIREMEVSGALAEAERRGRALIAGAEAAFAGAAALSAESRKLLAGVVHGIS